MLAERLASFIARILGGRSCGHCERLRRCMSALQIDSADSDAVSECQVYLYLCRCDSTGWVWVTPLLLLGLAVIPLALIVAASPLYMLVKIAILAALSIAAWLLSEALDLLHVRGVCSYIGECNVAPEESVRAVYDSALAASVLRASASIAFSLEVIPGSVLLATLAKPLPSLDQLVLHAYTLSWASSLLGIGLSIAMIVLAVLATAASQATPMRVRLSHGLQLIAIYAVVLATFWAGISLLLLLGSYRGVASAPEALITLPAMLAPLLAAIPALYGAIRLSRIFTLTHNVLMLTSGTALAAAAIGTALLVLHGYELGAMHIAVLAVILAALGSAVLVLVKEKRRVEILVSML